MKMYEYIMYQTFRECYLKIVKVIEVINSITGINGKVPNVTRQVIIGHFMRGKDF